MEIKCTAASILKLALKNIITNYEESVEQKKIEFEQKQKFDIEMKKKAAGLLEKELVSLT